MKRVIIESPYGADDLFKIWRNITYARLAIKDSLSRGEAPIASHLLYTQPGILDDEIPTERKLGMEAGFAWTMVADLIAVYTDNGISSGMEMGIARAKQFKKSIVFRSLYDSIQQQPSA